MIHTTTEIVAKDVAEAPKPTISADLIVPIAAANDTAIIPAVEFVATEPA